MIGDRQLQSLMSLGCPGFALVVPGKVERSMVKRGWLKPATGRSDGFLVITPAGLRELADALEAGRCNKFLKREFLPKT